MHLKDRLRIAIARRKADVFLRNEVASLGSEAQVGRALRGLLNEGVIVKLGIGVYAKAKPSVLSGSPIPVRPVEVLAEQAFAKMGVAVYPRALVAAYNAGETTQLPAGLVINTGDRRIVRRMGFGKQTIQYENNFGRAKRSH